MVNINIASVLLKACAPPVCTTTTAVFAHICVQKKYVYIYKWIVAAVHSMKGGKMLNRKAEEILNCL